MAATKKQTKKQAAGSKKSKAPSARKSTASAIAAKTTKAAKKAPPLAAKSAKPAAKRGVAKVTVERKPAKVVEAPEAKTPNKPGVAKASPKSALAVAAALVEGARLPAFSLTDHTGATVNHESLLGHPFVLYFYPKDDTPGCTKQACDFNADLAAFEAAGVRVIGVSPDSVSRHTNFRAKYGLQFTLLSDPDSELAKAFDVYKLKKNYGREYMGIERSTFLVGADGLIKKAWRGVRVAGHVPEVMAAAKQL